MPMSLYEYLKFVSEKIWLPHCKYKLHSHSAKCHVDPASLHVYAKTQSIAISTSHVIVMYMPETTIPLKCHEYATYEN